MCEDGDVQLVGGTSPHNGRIEFCQFGVWGTICDSLWDRVDSMVACRQLGINATGVCFFKLIFSSMGIAANNHTSQLHILDHFFEGQDQYFYTKFDALVKKTALPTAQLLKLLHFVTTMLMHPFFVPLWKNQVASLC